MVIYRILFGGMHPKGHASQNTRGHVSQNNNSHLSQNIMVSSVRVLEHGLKQ